MSDGRSTFGELVVRYRHAAGLTQEGLAEASGMSVRALRDLERGRTQAAQRRSAEVLADALALTEDDREVFLSTARHGRRRKAPRPVPANALSALPPALPDLVGRAEELTRLGEVAVGGGTVAVVGHPGVGKTVFAVSAAHRLRSQFPDGCFVVDLRGMDDQPLTARAALDRLLRALGVPESAIPGSEAEQSDLYRSVLAGRRVLVLLDNAADETQVRPLLPATPGCLALITCRHTLAGLEAVRWVWLEPLADSTAVELLAMIAGADRVATERSAADELVALCGNLPLAVRIAGNRLATRPHWSLEYLVGQLRDERTRLSALSVGDLQVRSAFEMSYRRLSPGARLVFRRLAAVPGADFGAELAEVATGMVGPAMRAHLDELADASLLQTAPAEGRFQFHDLIRIFAAERWEAEEIPAKREQVSHRVLEHLIGTASAAGSVYFPEGMWADGFSSRTEAGGWLRREESNWIAAQRMAARLGWHREVAELAKAMHWYSDSHWLGLPWAEIFQLGVDAAHALGDRQDEAKLLNFVGWAQHVCGGVPDAALVTYERALAVAVEVGDRLEEMWAQAYIGSALGALGRAGEALDHVRRACVLSEGFGFWAVRMSVRNRLGRILLAAGRYEEALSVHRALLVEADEQVGDEPLKTRRLLMAFVKVGVGNCLVALGEWRQAANTFREAQHMFMDASATGNAADAALAECGAWVEAGEYPQARECLRYALEIYGDLIPPNRLEQVRALRARLPAG